MRLIQWLLELIGLGTVKSASRSKTDRVRQPGKLPRPKPRRPKSTLAPFRYASASRSRREREVANLRSPPYRLARPSPVGGWLDLAGGGDAERLGKLSLPIFHNPEELAKWLNIPLGRLAWLTHFFNEHQAAADERASHYFYRWIAKRSGGRRLIEAPKTKLKQVQQRILADILDRIPPHPDAHGFVAARSIVTNARPHVGQRVVLKVDLENFYPSVSFNRVVAIFRSIGYCREAAVWLGRLTTNALPKSMRPAQKSEECTPYLRRRLPQGAPTSPALANLSAFSLDLRLAGLARTFGAKYTRYADDLTFSGDERFLKSLAVFIPLVRQIIRSQRFNINRRKLKVRRNNQRQTVTGVVVNRSVNISRRDYDLLKAILTNCIRRGPSTQNHAGCENFAAHLSGRIAHVAHLNPARGERLLALFRQIDWNR